WTPPTEEGLLPEMEATGDRHGVAADLPLEPAPEDWPAFRGPARDGSRGAGGVRIATDWAASPPREVWRRRVGAGWSAFAAVGDYLFTQEQRGPKEYVACYRADTGDEVWARGIAAHFTSNTGGGPRATPTYHRQRLYTLGATG